MDGKEEEGERQATSEQQYDQIVAALPSCKGLVVPMLKYHGFWYPHHQIRGAIAFHDHFKPRDTDVLLISCPKSGTQWLRALAFATLYRRDHDPFAHDHPLLRMNPLACVPMAEKLFAQGKGSEPVDCLPSPRLLHTHMGLPVLPESAVASPCKFVYICRNPKDTFVSLWHFCMEMVPSEPTAPLSFDEAFEKFCRGESLHGPVWDHHLGYWGESLRRPEKVLFLKYEDLTAEPADNLRRLAEFVGRPFSEQEERGGVVEGILGLCSLEKLRSVEANQKGHRGPKEVAIKNSSFFRKGEVGDWKNHLSPEMARRLDEITDEKLRGSGLSFRSD